ncbi:MAG: HAMP domain-containing histidine kinase [Ferruginibacter sp.]|nr:HAMP domain-containing histidine kinase [Ferruginibacter sp.]
MQKSPAYKPLLFKNSYLLILAACLLILSFIADKYLAGNSSLAVVQKTIEKDVRQREKDFDGLMKDSIKVRQMHENSFDENFLQQLAGKNYFIYRYFVNDIGLHKLIFWNSQTVLPDEEIINTKAINGFVKLNNGYYVWRKQITTNSITIALIPVKWNYLVTNNYLENSFVAATDLEKNYDISFTPTNAAVRSASGNHLFYLAEISVNTVTSNSGLAVCLRLLAAFLVLLFIHLVTSAIATGGGLAKALFFLIPVVAVLRLFSYYFPVPLNFRQFELFDPAIYGSSFVLRSLGDLLINAVLFTWVVLFIHNQVYHKNIKLTGRQSWFRWTLLALVCILLLGVTFTTAQVIRSMIADSQISFDVINFFSLSIYSVTGFIVLCCIAISYFLLSQVLLFLLKPMFPEFTWGLYLGIAVGGLAWLTIKLEITHAGFELCTLVWLVVYLFLLNRQNIYLSIQKMSSSRLIFWLFFFSLSITAVIVLENSDKELNQRKHYAETLSTKADPSSETLLNSFLTDFRNEYLQANFHRFFNDSTNHFFKDSLVSGNFSGYTNNYDTRIFTFDADQNPLFNKENAGFNELNTVLKTQAKPTNIPELYYYDESYDRFSYISRKTVIDNNGDTLGYVFILAHPKKNNNKTNALNLELFSRGKANAIENSPQYAFAIYNNLRLIDSHNDYAFATALTTEQLPKQEFEIIKKNGFDELWYKAGAQKVVIIVKTNNWYIETITLFSYLFCAFLLIAGIFWVLNIMVRSGFNRTRLKYYLQLNIRNQIHGTVIFISVISFLVIGIATILFFINRYENSNREKLSRVIYVMENEVRSSLSEMLQADTVVKMNDDAFHIKLQTVIDMVSKIHAVDANLYDLDGNLLVSSLPLPYNMGIISKKMDPVAFYHLNKMKEVQFFKEEQIGKLNFVSNYVPVIDVAGREYGYLNIPYFTSESKLQEEIANFLVTIINLNAFIFLIAGIIALFITNRITRSFSFISEKMKEVNLGKMNEAIDWKRNDEIGDLVKEYNKMVGKLDASAAALAKNEREGAWREMARQVAHEIKNPLTPMKLSLQYLQKAIETKSGNVEELTANVARTLVEQIEHLNHIAGEFGQFANIGNAKSEVFNLNEVIEQVTQLHAVDDRIHIHINMQAKPVMINADRTHINRLFTNLILNAMQAVPADRNVQIGIKEEVKGEKVLIKVKDNGNGISEAVQSKIFTPNFTTKTSGTGLGLAMSKGIVEQAKGRIWFETAAGAGTTFFVELPLAD